MKNVRLCGMNRLRLALVIGIVGALFSVMSGVVSGVESFSKASPEVVAQVGEERVRVDIVLKDSGQELYANSFSRDNALRLGLDGENIKQDFGMRVSAFITRSELEELEGNPFVESIDAVRYFHKTLQDAVIIMNVTDARNLQYGDDNLTGSMRSVCIIDTGVNYTHPSLGGCFGNNDPSSSCKVIGGYDYCADDSVCATEDAYPMDVDGHGTHVSGIVAASEGIEGVAIDSRIVMIKAGNSSGSFAIPDVISAIDWCVANASKFNISVISMSLGGGAYSTYCDGDWSGIAASVNNAIAHNIAVVASSGNDGSSTEIGSPACIQNVTPVGSTTKVDEISSFSNRNSLVKLFATGSSINSTCVLGDAGEVNGYCSKDGTSMSAPMVAGAIAVLSQFLNLSERVMTPSQIENVFYNNGKNISEFGNNYTRINLHAALFSLDNVAPDVSLVSPADNHVNLSVNQSFACNASDWQLANVTFKIWNSSGLYFNESRNLSGVENETSFDLTGLSEGDYEWNCETWDLKGNSDEAVSNFSLTVPVLEVSLDSPADDIYTNINESNFTCSARTDASYGLENVTFSLWNSSGELIFNESENVSGTENVTSFSYTLLSEGNYSWGCFAFNNNSDGASSVNFSFSYDATYPVISGLGSDPGESDATLSWTTNESSNSSIWVSGGSWSNSSDYVLSHSVSVSGLSASTSYNYIVRSCDRASNCVNDSGSFVTDAVAVVPSGGGGGGGSSSVAAAVVEEENESVVHDISKEEIFAGYSNELRENDSLNFRVNDYGGGRHSLIVEEIGEDYVYLVIHSEPVGLKLFVGEERKLNLSSPDYYDLLVKLNGVSDGVADLSVRRIDESVVATELDEVGVSVDEVYSFNYSLFAILLSLVLILVVFALNRKKVKKRKPRRGNGKKNKKVKTKAVRKR